MRLFLHYVGACLRVQAQYPGSTLLLTLAQTIGSAIDLVVIWALFERFDGVHGFRLGEVLTFYGFANLEFAIADMITRGLDAFGTQFVRTGQFDRLLLRPRALMLQLMGHDVRISRLGRIVQSVAALALATERAPIDWSFSHLALALFAVAGGVALFVGLLILQATLAFWTVESLEIANVFTHGGAQAAQFPLAIYGRWFRRILTFCVPIACVTYFPMLAILERPDPLGSPRWLQPLTPTLGFAFLAITFLAWRHGVRRYTSTGS